MELGLAGRVALVAGSSRGIGLAAARSLLVEGAKVAVTGRDRLTLEHAAGALREEFGDRVLAIGGDLSDDADISTAINHVIERWHTLDCVVANVGSGRAASGWDANDEKWAAAFEMNFGASRRLIRCALPFMIRAGRGSIVVVASIAGIESMKAPLAYAAAKASLLAYSKGLAREVASSTVRVNAIAPGNVLFAGGSWDKHLLERRDEVMQYITSEVPMRRFGTPEEIADVIAFLCSDRAGFMTGSCVVVDGGQTRTFA